MSNVFKKILSEKFDRENDYFRFSSMIRFRGNASGFTHLNILGLQTHEIENSKVVFFIKSDE